MTFDHATLTLLADALAALDHGFDRLPPSASPLDLPALGRVLTEAAERLRDNFPYHHPLYMGQMLKPPHPIARLAYALAMQINPNNHALDGGRASSAMEKEAVAQIAGMFGWTTPAGVASRAYGDRLETGPTSLTGPTDVTHLGHLCGGGTIANFEALWVARELRPGWGVAASAQAHYTHPRLADVLGMPFYRIASDARGKMNIAGLEAALAAGLIGTVVATIGTTAAGAIDPLFEILALRARWDFRVHVDAAYGGYFTLADNLTPEARRAFDRIADADSIVIDPHKHGLQPYGCGCVLFRDPAVGRIYKHDSPYTYFSSPDLHLGEISLECSRPGAAAVALWATMRLLPLERGGEFARGLAACRAAALRLYEALRHDAPLAAKFVPLFAPELDIVVWAVRGRSARESSALARTIFDAAAQRDLHLALARFPRAMVEPSGAVEVWDEDEVVCLRACVMKPEHGEWMPEILSRLRAAIAG